MKNFDKINPNQICLVEGYVKKEYEAYEFHPKKKTKFLWFTSESPDHFRKDFGDEGYMKLLNEKEVLEEEENNVIIEDNIVYHKPYIVFHMSDGDSHRKYFDTEDKLETFMATIGIHKINWINL